MRPSEIRAQGITNIYTTPGLAWQALLKIASEYCELEKRGDCKVCLDEFRLELLTDIDMLC